MKQTKVTDIAYKPSAEGIIASMEAQLKNPKIKQKWDSPFKRKSGIGKNALTGNYYTGSNLMLTMLDSEKNKYAHAIYATEKQWKTLNCKVVKGSPSLPITFWKNIEEESKRVKGKKVVVSSFFLKLVNNIQLN